jgi:hypothetical protein
MSRPKAKTFADRLPPVVPREEDDISHLSDEMVDILYPGRRPRPFRLGVVFDAFEGDGSSRALDLARESPVYRETRDGERRRHHAAFDASQASAFHALYLIVGSRSGTDVLVDNKRVPYARELWIPLFLLHLPSKE